MDALHDLDDRVLLERCRCGNRDAFGVFYARHREAILGYIARRTAQPEVAVDLMAETFAKALVSVLHDEGPLPDHPVGWLYVIARNLVVDAVRRGKVDAAARQRLALEPLVIDDDDLARVAEIAAAADTVSQVTAGLPESEWRLLRARLVDEAPYADLAVQLQCSEQVVRKRVSRAKAHVRAMLGGSNA